MIRRMTVEDISRVSEIETDIFTSAWSSADFIYEITENPFGYYCVWEQAGQIIGYIGLWILYEQAQVTTLGVVREWRRKGVAKELLSHGIKHAFDNGVTTISLEVRISNSAAIRLYESAGFQIRGRREDYYQDNHEDAYLMILERN
jgi:[ribosomal protein S18]-alanine N-acetyltransferase